jgi:hypothetical protein
MRMYGSDIRVALVSPPNRFGGGDSFLLGVVPTLGYPTHIDFVGSLNHQDLRERYTNVRRNLFFLQYVRVALVSLQKIDPVRVLPTCTELVRRSERLGPPRESDEDEIASAIVLRVIRRHSFLPRISSVGNKFWRGGSSQWGLPISTKTPASS